MHLAYLIDNLGPGGAQRQVVELALELVRAHGARVDLVVYRDSDFHGAALHEAGIRVDVVPKSHKYDLRLPGRLRRWLRAARPDLVHAYLLAPSLWARLAVRGMPAAERPAFVAAERGSRIATGRLEGAVQRFVYRGSDAVTVNAECVGDAIVRRLGVPASRVRYLPNGIRLSRWDRAGAEPCPLELAPDHFHLALIGALRPGKNHRLVLEALARLGRERIRNWRVWFIGGDSYLADFSEGIRDEIVRSGLGDVVRAVPATTAIAAVMQHLDGVLLPSAHEGFPNVVLEAMASRLPVIASAVGDVPNLIDTGRTGFVLEQLTVAALAAAMARLHDLGSEGRRAVGTRAREVVEARYRMSRIAGEHADFYRRVLEDRHRATDRSERSC